VEIADAFEGVPIVDKALSASPFELVEPVSTQGEAFTKGPHGEVVQLQDLSGPRLHPAQG